MLLSLFLFLSLIIDVDNKKSEMQNHRPFLGRRRGIGSFIASWKRGAGFNLTITRGQTVSPITASQLQVLGACPNNGVPVSLCNAGSCDTSGAYTCVNNLYCCPATSTTVITNINACPSGTTTTGQRCISGLCLNGALCNKLTNYCCSLDIAVTTVAALTCPSGTTAAGLCVNNQCPVGSLCIGTNCCELQASCPTGTEVDGACEVDLSCPNIGSFCIGTTCCKMCPIGLPIDQCDDNNQCQISGYSCNAMNNLCCPTNN